MLTFLAFLICAVKFPFVGRGPELEKMPADTWPRVNAPGRWIHDMTNVAVEMVRSDCEWFTKCMSIVILASLAALISSWVLA